MTYRIRRRWFLRTVFIAWSSAVMVLCAGFAVQAAQSAVPEDTCVTASAVSDLREEWVQLTHEELELMTRVISAEARGESFEGQVAVGAVILNRVEHRDFPDSVTEVCTQPGAFCGVSDGQINIEPSESCRRAALAALSGEDPTGGALYFYNPKTAASDWIRSRPVVVIIGAHWFCI